MWKTAFKKFEVTFGFIFEYFVPYITYCTNYLEYYLK